MGGSNDLTGAAVLAFVAVVVVVNIWKEVSARRGAQQLIRLAIERNAPIDAALIDRILRGPADRDPAKRFARGAVLLALGIGFPIMGYFIKVGGDDGALWPLAGLGVLFVLMGAALLMVGWLAGRDTRSQDDRRAS